MSSQALFYVAVLPVTWLILRLCRSAQSRQALLLFVSYLLYAAWGPRFLELLICSSLANYILGLWLRAQPSAGRLWVGILVNIALLSTFKYGPELLPILSHTRLAPPLGRIVLPVGISFWTFQAISYLLDLYREEGLDPSCVEFLLYMAFWPTVLSGPICRLSNLLPQFRNTQNSTLDEARQGIDRISIGLLMIALGEILATGVHLNQGLDSAFQNSAAKLSGSDVWCLAFGYGFELFFNFAGYSHIVIGAARLFGFTLAENFDRPYLSTTPSEFWTRWHMSLSSWIRDYLFLPLVMLHRSRVWRNAALVISMLVFGLWHKGTALLGLWGLYHGFLLVLHRQWQELKRRFGWTFSGRFNFLLSWLVTICSICLGWILFRSESLVQAMTMLRSVTMLSSYATFTLPHSLYILVLTLLIGYLVTVSVQKVLREHRHRFALPIEVLVALYSLAVYLGLLHGLQTQSFVYFQF